MIESQCVIVAMREHFAFVFVVVCVWWSSLRFLRFCFQIKANKVLSVWFVASGNRMKSLSLIFQLRSGQAQKTTRKKVENISKLTLCSTRNRWWNLSSFSIEKRKNMFFITGSSIKFHRLSLRMFQPKWKKSLSQKQRRWNSASWTDYTWEVLNICRCWDILKQKQPSSIIINDNQW